MLIVYWPITIKFRTREQTSKPQTNYRCCLRFSYLAPYWLIFRNICYKYLWCSRFCESHSKITSDRSSKWCKILFSQSLCCYLPNRRSEFKIDLKSPLRSECNWLKSMLHLFQCNYLIPACCCITLLRVFNVPAYSSNTNFPAVVCLFLLYGWVEWKRGETGLSLLSQRLLGLLLEKEKTYQ